MAICSNKYSHNELRRFTDSIENVLKHDVCRAEYKEFLQKMSKNDLVKVLEIWERAEEIEKTPETPERKRKIDFLQEMVEDNPTFSTIDEDKDEEFVLQVKMKVYEHPNNMHQHFVRYLRKKYM